MTDDDSLLLYASQFSPDTLLTVADQVYLKGSAASGWTKHSTRQESDTPQGTSAFVRKAERVGIAIRPYPSKVSSVRASSLAAGFEQINDNMYSRIANKFMVFNRAGVNTWKSLPTTRSCPVETILMSTATSANV